MGWKWTGAAGMEGSKRVEEVTTKGASTCDETTLATMRKRHSSISTHFPLDKTKTPTSATDCEQKFVRSFDDDVAVVRGPARAGSNKYFKPGRN